MNRIQQLFKDKQKDILSVFFTAGFPQLQHTREISISLDHAGADMIEIGIPFSDPIADGPVIQESNRVALEQGMTLRKLLEQVKELRSQVKMPVILMGYLNPVLQYGMEQFCADASKAGVDGLILPDMPMEEYLSEYSNLFKAHNLLNIFMIAPTTSEERIRQIDNVSDGFIYAVSSSSTTGSRREFNQDQLEYFKKLKNMHLQNPLLIGFGISNHETFVAACGHSRGAIVGSAFITLLKESKNLNADIRTFVKEIRG